MPSAEPCPCTRFSLAEILVLAGGVIPPAPAVPTSTKISARLKRISPLNVSPVNRTTCARRSRAHVVHVTCETCAQEHVTLLGWAAQCAEQRSELQAQGDTLTQETQG